MKKKVNGTVVDITNIDLFKLAYEGKLLNKKASSKVRDRIENKGELVKDLVTNYCDILDSLVFPLNMIETSMKYTMIASVLMDRMKENYGLLAMQVDNSICIEIEDGTVLRLLAGTWAIEATPSTYAPTINNNLDLYKGQLGYTEYTWAQEQLLAFRNTSEYYEVFMKDFLDACKGQDMVLKWELSRLLDFGIVPKAENLAQNKILDKDTEKQYTLDIYSTGKQEVNDNVMEFRKASNGKAELATEKKKIKVYGFDVYCKNAGEINNQTRKVDMIACGGLAGLFETLLFYGISDDRITTLNYTGIVSDDLLLFEINKDVYLTSFRDYSDTKKLMSNVHLYAFEAGRVYVKRRKRMYSGVYEETIYSYELETAKARLCKISYVL